MKNPIKFIQEVKQEAFKVTWPTWKETLQDPDDAHAVSYGHIAQEEETVIPELVHTAKETDTEPNAWKSVAYEKVVPLLIETIKELEARIAALEG